MQITEAEAQRIADAIVAGWNSTFYELCESAMTKLKDIIVRNLLPAPAPLEWGEPNVFGGSHFYWLSTCKRYEIRFYCCYPDRWYVYKAEGGNLPGTAGPDKFPRSFAEARAAANAHHAGRDK